MVLAAAAMERAMKIQQVIMRALSGAITWLQAADILGLDPRSVRRWRARYEAGGAVALYDRRCQRPSRRKAPAPEVQRILRLYRERFAGWNVRHFYRFARRDHGVTLSYSFVKLALQEAGLVRRARARGRHRRRREPRPCFGELLHLDGSRHRWLRHCPEAQQTLIAVIDDATKRLLYAQLWAGETTAAVMTALHRVFSAHGLPAALYTDRAGWAFHTPKAGARVDRPHLTQVGRALAHLGIEHIPSYSPQGRGRSERLNRTLQGRLLNELHLAGIDTIAAANAYLTEQFIPSYNEEFAHAPADPASAFVPLHGVDLDTILCHEEERTVGQDNVVALERVALQLAKQPGRRTCAGLRVTVRRDLHGGHSVWHGARCLGRYDAHGQPLLRGESALPAAPAARSRRQPPQPKNARAHLEGRAARGPRRSLPRPLSLPKRRCRPRLPIGPGV
jgi:transposase